MARQAVSETGHFFLGLLQVAIQAPPHIHFGKLPGYIHAANLTMAGFTVDTRAKVRLVVEINKIGLDVDFHPGDGFTAFEIAGNLLNLRVI
jgi:hypothetical protein